MTTTMPTPDEAIDRLDHWADLYEAAREAYGDDDPLTAFYARKLDASEMLVEMVGA